MKRRLLFHVLFVSAAHYVSHGLLMVRGLTLASLLGPAGFGIWSSMRILQTFSHFATLGAGRGMIQLAPLAEGAGDREEAEALRQVSSGMCLLVAVVVGVAVALFALTAATPAVRQAWLLFAACLLIIHAYHFYQSALQSRQHFTRSGAGELTIAVLTTSLGLLAAWALGLMGFLAVIAAAYVAALGIMLWRGARYPRPRLDVRHTRQLIGIGFPLMASAALATLLWNVDKLLLWMVRDYAALGEYSVQASFTNVALLAPAAITTVLHPHLMANLGRSRTAQTVSPYLIRGGELVAVWSAPIIAVGVLVLHLPIRWWLPEYVEAIMPGRILMLAAYGTMIATVPTVVVVSLGGYLVMCGIRAVAIAVAAAGGWWALEHDPGYVGLALAMAGALALDAALSVAAAIRRIELAAPEALRFIGGILLPVVILIAALALAWSITPTSPASWQRDVLATVARLALVVPITTAWAAWRSRHLRLL